MKTFLNITNILIQILFIICLVHLHAPLNVGWIAPMCSLFLAQWMNRIEYETIKILLFTLVFSGITTIVGVFTITLESGIAIIPLYILISLLNGILPYYFFKKTTVVSHTIVIKDYTIK